MIEFCYKRAVTLESCCYFFEGLQKFGYNSLNDLIVDIGRF